MKISRSLENFKILIIFKIWALRVLGGERKGASTKSSTQHLLRSKEGF